MSQMRAMPAALVPSSLHAKSARVAVDPAVPGARCVFVVEDDLVLSASLSSHLQDAGFDVEILPGAEGIEALMSRNPSLVMLDVALHRSDAVEVLQRLGEQGYRGAIQLMSGGQTELLAQIKRIGERRGMTMLPVLHKPFDVGAVVSIIERHARVDRDCGAVATVERAPTAGNRIDLRLALDQGWIEVWYQPKYDTRSLSLVGAECLCRLRHPDHGIIGPGAFLPGAEASDLRRLTELVLSRACADWTTFAEAGAHLRLAVNIPCVQLTTMPLVRLLRDWIPKVERWGGLVLEVTEEQALQDIDASHEIGTQLKIYGIDLSIDDFGTGYSSLARLREIPFKEIKLDRTLVDGCADDATRAGLCRAIIDLSHTLGAVTVAEGVERQEDLSFLRDAGCDLAQGFLLARPMPRDALTAAIRSSGPHEGGRRAED